MKGVLLCGGAGTRLAPLTALTNKHLLPVGMRFMVEYPLATLVRAGVREILLITGSEFCGDFVRLLGSGVRHGCDLTYRIQERRPDVAGGYGGIGQAIALAESFSGGEPIMVMLGDNVLGCDLMDIPERWAKAGAGAMSFFVDVGTRERARQFGIGTFVRNDDGETLVKVTEKPDEPDSTRAQIGVYLFDARVFNIIRSLRPSSRGQIEVTDIVNVYLGLKLLTWAQLPGPWTDAGTPESYAAACEMAWKGALG